jgi:hypothetical protein
MRAVITKEDVDGFSREGHTVGPVCQDTYRERLVKYIPVESVALYVAVYGICSFVLGNSEWFSVIARWILIAGIIGTWLWLWKIENVHSPVQLVISTAGFVFWVLALGVPPFANLPFYNQIPASLILPAWIFLSPLIVGIPERW